MLVYPQIDPVAFSIGPLAVHWYGLMYLLGFTMAWGLGQFRAKHYHLPWTSEQIADLIFYSAIGVIVGGRLGYMLFYSTQALLAQPLLIFKIWEGGMSFHGALVGAFIALVIFGKRMKKPVLVVTDFFVPLVPLGLAAGRIGNFINGELWGRVTDMPWGMVFPNSDGLPRHPSQLYEVGCEGIALFILVWWYASKPRPPGTVSGIFLMGYAISRLIIECFREPDRQLGYIAFDCLTMGQLLSIPMLIAGFILWWVNRNENVSATH